MSIPSTTASDNRSFDLPSTSPNLLHQVLELIDEASWLRYGRNRGRDVVVMLRLLKAQERRGTCEGTDADWAQELGLNPDYFARVVARVRQENLMEPDSHQLHIAEMIDLPPALIPIWSEDEAWERYIHDYPRDVFVIQRLMTARSRLHAPHWTDADWAEELRLKAAYFARILARARERNLMEAGSYELLVGPRSAAPQEPPAAPQELQEPSTRRVPLVPMPSPSTARVRAYRARQQRVSRNGYETPHETPHETLNETERALQSVSRNDIESNRIDSYMNIDIESNRSSDETHETPDETLHETPPASLSTEEPAAAVIEALLRACRGKMTPQRAQTVVATHGTARCRDVLDSLPHWNPTNPVRMVEDALKSGPAKYPLHPAVLKAREKARQGPAQKDIVFLEPVSGGKAAANAFADWAAGKGPLPGDAPPMTELRQKAKGSSG